MPTSTDLSALPRLTLVDNPPNARRTMEALRDMGYDSYASILDLIDNSIDAQAKTIRVTVSEQKGDIVIAIADDGIGMDQETLSEALRLGSDTGRETSDLGKFGMGLVTASIGLSQKVELLTKEAAGPLLYGGFDLQEIRSQDRFVKRVGKASPEMEFLFSGDHGTILTLSNTDRISNRHTTTFGGTLRKRISQVFRKFLKSQITIDVNNQRCQPTDVLMLSAPETRVLLETELEVADGAKAHLRCVELPDYGKAGNSAHEIIAQNAGFYVLRNNREIMSAETFDFFRKHPDWAHFRAELAFDGTLDGVFHTDIKKATIHLEQSFLDRLKGTTMGLIEECARRGRQRANQERGQINHSIAEANINRRTALIPKPLSLLEKRSSKAKKGSHSPGEGPRNRTPHLTHLKTPTGLRIAFNEGDYGVQSPFYLVSQEGRTITVTYNREHPFWRELIVHADDPKVVAILDYLVFALANSELLVPEPSSVVKAYMNSTLVGLLV